MPDNKVGYKNPPKHTQYKKGETGNAAGRRVEQDRFASVLRDELAKEIVMKIGDKKEKATVLRGLTRLLINRALAGDKNAIAELMRQINRYFPEAAAEADTSLPPSDEDVRLLDDYVRRQLARNQGKTREVSDGQEF